MTSSPNSTDASPWLESERTLDYFKGRVALFAILEAAGIGREDEVLVPGFTCVAVPAAVLYRGAIPVYYDVQPHTLNGDPDLALANLSPRTRAIVVQHNFGSPAPLGALLTVARERDLVLIEDCAHALGATLDGQPVGTLGDAAFCSLQWSKPVTTGLGGIARYNHPELLRRARDAHLSYVAPSLRDRVTVATLSFLYRHLYGPRLFWKVQGGYRWLSHRGWVSGSSSPNELTDPRMPDDYRRRCWASDPVLRSTLRDVPTRTEHRRKLAERYRERLESHGFFSPTVLANSQSSWLRYPTLVEDRPRVLARARESHVEIGDWFNAPVHPRSDRAGAFGYAEGTCPHAEWIAQRIVNLPTHPRVSVREADRITDFLLTQATPVHPPTAEEPTAPKPAELTRPSSHDV